MSKSRNTQTLVQAVVPSAQQVLNPEVLAGTATFRPDQPVLVVLAAGRGSRFGQPPKCAQPVCGVPLARHSIDAFRSYCDSPVICVVGHRHEEVTGTIGDDVLYVRSENPTGGTAFAAFEAFSIPELDDINPLLIITMGDRIVTPSVFRCLVDNHRSGPQEASLSFLSAVYNPPKHRGKGRLVRDTDGKVVHIIEERDIEAIEDPEHRRTLLNLTEGNCPLYAVRAATLRRILSGLSSRNAQGQYYITDIVGAVNRDGGEIRTITTIPDDLEYDLLCSDLTRPDDLKRLESVLLTTRAAAPTVGLEAAVDSITTGRPAGQIESITCQLEELLQLALQGGLDFQPDRPVGLGIAGGRLRIAFMHPDMGRFFGPAWQMPIGAADSSSRQQIVVLVQSSTDNRITLLPKDLRYREEQNFVPADSEWMYPGTDIVDGYAYESFGTRMAAQLLGSLGYASDEELETLEAEGKPLPPPTKWISNSLRRPFSLVANALTSIRTVRDGLVASRVRAHLSRDRFRGLHVLSTGDVPQGGFSSSTAVTVATMNAVDAFYRLGLSPDLLVGLACWSEYGTGVRAGSLDHATIQKGRHGAGALISSNPRDNYRIIGTYPVPTHRYQVLFPYSVDRDREAWKWSAGMYSDKSTPGKLTAAEMRKMTGKAAEIAAILTRLPFRVDFFQEIEGDLTRDGVLGPERSRWVYELLKSLPLRITKRELTQRLEDHRQWTVDQLIDVHGLDPSLAADRADTTLKSLLSGWEDPLLLTAAEDGQVVEERGAPLRAMIAYLFAEVAKNFYLIHHPEAWIETVSLSQRGDCCFEIDSDLLPPANQLLHGMDWEEGVSGPSLLEMWLNRVQARPCNVDRDLTDECLSSESPPALHRMTGGNFFRGLALIDLVEAMLKRAFGKLSVAVRINAAGQGDYFQVHVDTQKASVEEVKQFIRKAFYKRFGLSPEHEFAELHSGGGAVGLRLDRFDSLPDLINRLRGERPAPSGSG